MAATCDYKLVFLGDTAVGKSCMVGRFVRDEYLEFQESTIGAAFVTQTIKLEDAIIKFEIWDTAGQERYRSLAPMYYRGAAAAIVVFDISNADSYDGPNGAKSWVKELQRRGDSDVVVALAGNKADLEKERQVPTEDAASYAKENGLIYVECSAKTGMNVQEVFRQIARRLPRNTQVSREPGGVHLPPADSSEKKKDGCC